MSDATPTETDSPQARTYHGSCHCGFIKFTVSDLIISSQTVSRCNCTHCHKSNYFLTKLPYANFTLTSPSALSEIPLYKFGYKYASFYFCPTCAVKPFGVWPVKDKPGELAVCVNLVTLDDADLSEVVCKRYWNCKEDDPRNFKLGEKPWPGGAI